MKKDMVVLELDRVEVDHCLVCGGLWLDAGELELLAGTPDKATALAILFRDLSDTAGETARPCPICGAKMMKQATATEPPLVIDRCPAGHGVWFDDGELHALFSCLKCGAENRVFSLLQDMFAARIQTSVKGG
ncbi:MAG TPA: zf-TFIIB domain-containing protein [bacterium]|nr:zf-TFIIB domain-containing protein [bacterium]